MDHPFPSFPTVAVIEDDEDLRANLLLTLRSKNFPTWGAASAEEFYRERAVSPADIVLIDLGLPGEDGLSVLRHLRQSSMLGIIVITARGGIENRIAGLEAGADQYFIKPVDARELLATIEGLWRRIKVQQVNVAIPLAENSTSNLLAWHVLPAESALGLSDGRKLPLSEREYLLISCLLDAEGAVVSKQALHAAVFPDVEQIDKHRLDVVISRLRQKTENQLAISLPIRTIFGKGFALATPRQIRASEN